MLVRAILDLDGMSLSKKCFDYRSVVKWSVRDDGYGSQNEALRDNSGRIRGLQNESSGGQLENRNSSAGQSSNNLRLFQMSDHYHGTTPWKMGLASSDIRSGDLIFWLQWPRRAVVVRPEQPGDGYRTWKLQVVGTAVVTEDLRESCLSRSQRADWSEKKSSLTIYLDASTIFVLLA
jgi:hypothetical protein